MENIEERAILWLMDHGIRGKIISRRLHDGVFTVVVETGPKISIPLNELAVFDVPDPERPSPVPEPLPPPKPKRTRTRKKKI